MEADLKYTMNKCGLCKIGRLTRVKATPGRDVPDFGTAQD